MRGLKSESGDFHAAKVINDSGRPIRDVVCRLQTSQGGDMYPAKLVGRVVTPADAQVMRRFTDQAEDDKIRLVRAGQIFGFVFPVDTNRQAILTLRFTDDAGLYWQVDDDLHLEPLDSRDW